MNEDYNGTTLALGICIALAIVLVAIVAFNWGEIWQVISTEGLLSE